MKNTYSHNPWYVSVHCIKTSLITCFHYKNEFTNGLCQVKTYFIMFYVAIFVQPQERIVHEMMNTSFYAHDFTKDLFLDRIRRYIRCWFILCDIPAASWEVLMNWYSIFDKGYVEYHGCSSIEHLNNESTWTIGG